MSRAATVILRLVVATAVALVLLGLWQWALSGSPAAGFAEGARRLFLFMDIGLVVWVVLLAVGEVRGWGIRAAIVSAVIGVALNLATVTVVGLLQSGALPWEFIGWALGAGVAFLLGATVAVLAVKPRRARATPV